MSCRKHPLNCFHGFHSVLCLSLSFLEPGCPNAAGSKAGKSSGGGMNHGKKTKNKPKPKKNNNNNRHFIAEYTSFFQPGFKTFGTNRRSYARGTLPDELMKNPSTVAWQGFLINSDIFAVDPDQVELCGVRKWGVSTGACQDPGSKVWVSLSWLWLDGCRGPLPISPLVGNKLNQGHVGSRLWRFWFYCSV